MSETYSIPSSPIAFFDFQRGVLAYCNEAASRLNIPADKLSDAATKQNPYEAAYRVAADSSTQNPTATADRNEKAAILKDVIIDIYDHNLLNNILLTDADRKALHINTATGGGGTSTPAPLTSPIITMVPEEASALHVLYSDPSAPGTHYKPAGVAFCELCYKVGEPAPATIAECTERHNIARSHEAIVFQHEQRGKTIYAHARWVNKNGKTGPWGNLVTAIIP